MEFEINAELVTEHKLTDEAVTAITGQVTTALGTQLTETENRLKGEFDGKANTDKNNILDQISKGVTKKFGFRAREDAEKFEDFAGNFLGFLEKGVKEKETELDKKIKDSSGIDQVAKDKLATLETERPELLEIVGKYNKIVDDDVLGKFESLQKEHTSQTNEISWQKVKPACPEGVNEFEFDAKWNDMVRGVEATHHIKWDADGKKGVGVNKEKSFETFPLDHFVSKDEPFQELLKGRQQPGSGAGTGKEVTIEGLPFTLPKGANIQEITERVTKHVNQEIGTDTFNPKWKERFRELSFKAQGVTEAA